MTAGHGIAALPGTMRVFERGWLSSNNILFFDADA
ncbi:MBL fold metallo-hydrolase, partial [Ralstonia pseudosolanacearum]